MSLEVLYTVERDFERRSVSQSRRKGPISSINYNVLSGLMQEDKILGKPILMFISHWLRFF